MRREHMTSDCLWCAASCSQRQKQPTLDHMRSEQLLCIAYVHVHSQQQMEYRHMQPEQRKHTRLEHTKQMRSDWPFYIAEVPLHQFSNRSSTGGRNITSDLNGCAVLQRRCVTNFSNSTSTEDNT